MLRELMIRDFAIIEKLDINFESKMTVLTGETGAGKSIVIDALGLLAGSRGSQEFIRKGANKAILQGLFGLPKNVKIKHDVESFGITADEDVLIIQRELYRNGRSVCRINNTLVTLTALKKIGNQLIDIHGQNEHQMLMNSENHIGLLDQYNQKTTDLKVKYNKLFEAYREKLRILKKRQSDEQKWAQRLDMLQFQVQEITEANLVLGEDADLEIKKQKLENFQTIRDALSQSYELLSGEEADFLGHLGDAVEATQKVGNLSEDLHNIADNLSSAFYTLQDAAHDISNELDVMEWNEDELNQTNQRLEVIKQLEHKYGNSIEKVLDYYNKIERELAQMQSADEDSEIQQKAVDKTYSEALATAEKLSHERTRAAKKLSNAVEMQLKSLYMDQARFEVHFGTDKTVLASDGIDRVEFYIQTNQGEASGPLAKIASGGELSRIMLALKTIFSQDRNLTSIIFDEVDTGVSGRVAQAMAEKISQIAQLSQVLCITHLPQVAAISNHHYLVTKEVIKGRTETNIEKLNEEKRITEIARMLAGTEITKLTMEHAKELLEMAKKLRT
ncbi:DNA repair protein RecN [Lactobacillus sp. UCMA15818]|uniref:DNA repair protein RecN n=1 Tax=Lactobacillus sp. UCMA15818 TaxID=2583394 RepID=UPI0025B27B17|nr:DNA repair protein RecN [Lactobacillus sp. UCMA15818]MDN2452363.1 DNA repair protein RecN [Lactobacillus sp. UCMA15818]